MKTTDCITNYLHYGRGVLWLIHSLVFTFDMLQGTTNMLLSFDASQVRKICRDCKKVLDYLAISEVIETMEDLVQFVKDLSPCLSKVSQDVEGRQNDLLNPQQRESLGLHLEQIKTLAPILICSMKIFIQILNQQGTGTDEAIANRNYLAGRMHDEISEVKRLKRKIILMLKHENILGDANS